MPNPYHLISRDREHGCLKAIMGSLEAVKNTQEEFSELDIHQYRMRRENFEIINTYVNEIRNVICDIDRIVIALGGRIDFQ